MGVIQRFKDIMSANINAMLDKAENPEKMIDQYMRNLEDDLGKVKAETASVMAEEARAKRAYDEALAEVEKYQKYAEKAVAAGNDNDARVFLQSKKTAQSKLEGLKLTYDTACLLYTSLHFFEWRYEMRIAYVRVSTEEQNEARQREEMCIRDSYKGSTCRNGIWD